MTVNDFRHSHRFGIVASILLLLFPILIVYNKKGFFLSQSHQYLLSRASISSYGNLSLVEKEKLFEEFKSNYGKEVSVPFAMCIETE